MSWTTIRRETGLIEHVCSEHGTGHPNAGSIQYLAWRDERAKELDDDDGPVFPIPPTEPFETHWGIHGCCGCCKREDFPGRAIGSIKHAFSEYLKLQEQKDIYGRDFLDDLFKDHFLLFWGILAAVDEANRKGINQ